MNKFLKNVSYMLIVNILSFLITAIITFIVPKFLTVKEYSYFQLYMFYLNYIGFCCIGWIDGIVLRYAGSDYDVLDKKVFKGQLKLYTLLEIFIGGIVIIAMAFIPMNDTNEQFVYLAVGIAIIVVQINAFFRYIMQIVNSVDEYAKNILIEKLIYFGGVVVLILAKQYSFKYLILVDLLGKSVALVRMVLVNKEIVESKSSPIKDSFIEAKKNVSVGIKLLAANGSGLLIIGVVRYAIQQNWDVETFGKVSLSLSVSNMFMVFVQAIGIALFPMLKRISQELLCQLYYKIRQVLMIPMLGILIFYYPVYLILSTWLPAYAESLHYMALMFPICIFESKIQLLIEPYLKSLRKEKELLKTNISAVALSFVCSVIFIGIMNNLNLAVIGLVFTIGYRCIVLELIIEKALNINLKKDILQEVMLVSLFMIFNWKIGGIIGVILYFICYVIYLIVNKENLKNVIELVQSKIKLK